MPVARWTPCLRRPTPLVCTSKRKEILQCSVRREKWDCDGFSEQTPDFIKGVKDGKVEWGYTGKHSSDAKEDITVAEVRWLLQYLSRLSDHQIMMALEASGATSSEIQCFTKAIRDRIEQMSRIAPGQQITLK
jgi:hypothetical protein